MKIAVGLSGGVDSAVTAHLLKEQGYDILGVTMAIWDQSVHSSGNTGKHACFGPEEQEDINEARALCQMLNVPFEVYDCSNEYKRIILDYFKREYLAGRTPNPCIQCNQQIKLDVLPSMVHNAGMQYDKFATGHYARIEYDEQSARYLLKKAHDISRDQTYFLYRLTQQQLKGLMLPLGEMTKGNVREIAKNAGIHVFDKPDSQDFYSGDYNDLINISDRFGNIVHINGNVLGQHKGVWNYTIGQRKGLGISWHEPLFVIELNAHTNQVIVGPKAYVYNDTFLVGQLNWIAIEGLDQIMHVKAKIRSAQKYFDALIEPVSDEIIKVISTEPVSAITPGQSAVFYQNDIVIGGGIIEKAVA